LERLPISEKEYNLIHDLPKSSDPSDFRYGFYRLPAGDQNLTLDLTHVKRIRGNPEDPEKVDIILTTKSDQSSIKDHRSKIEEMLQQQDDQLKLSEVKVPH